MTMANQTLTTILGGQIVMGGKKISHFGFNRLRQKLASTLA